MTKSEFEVGTCVLVFGGTLSEACDPKPEFDAKPQEAYRHQTVLADDHYDVLPGHSGSLDGGAVYELTGCREQCVKRERPQYGHGPSEPNKTREIVLWTASKRNTLALQFRSGMTALDDIHRRLRVSNLQAKLELFEMERIALLREMTSEHTTYERRHEAIKRRAELRTACAEIAKVLKDLDQS